ncbi:DUF1295 domain-containing protein [Nitrospirillum pindoramense]|uniref:Steroid 5-alpha reductase family enzyme n=1 Tax=Nitrospirillum amazonense TaxID=28077 RepID=A0A560HI10_9PROT|nr:DUF1295 domain-containing protein [Nitrospirillum amazonense]TWB46098.1 steroid 5-alpha reductase family enzyme [Nitrospirillum amazonense]
MIPLALLLAIALGQSALMALAWAVQRLTRQSGWVDATWSFTVGAGGLCAALIPVGDLPTSARQVLVATLVGLWSARLAGHIALRTRGAGDDPRYAELMRTWGARAPSRLFWFLQSQAVAAALLAITVYIAARNPAPGLGVLDVVGTLVLLAGIAGEGIADAQLTRFRHGANSHAPNAQGRICDVGLWRWSRHPNYFFEWLIWLAYPCFALVPSVDGPWTWGWLAFIGPAMMYGLLVHVSGIPPLEAHMARSRGAAFAAYCQRTSAFFPLPPRRPDTD